MLSINVPVYNIEIGQFVLQLSEQGQKLGVPFEIRIYDDGSQAHVKKKNKKVCEFENVTYVELEKNLGRSAIRNKMGFDSKYEYLLFIDADSLLVKSNYLETFLKNAHSSRVLCGGTAYQNQKPREHEKLLRWVYGSRREAVSAEIRNGKKGFIITSNNFLIPKPVFMKIHFREDIKNYGHEDTLLGYDLFKNHIEIFHINNPVEHTGLENSKAFLQKTKTALENLKLISTNLLKSDTNFTSQVFFLNRFSKLTTVVPTFILRLFYRTWKNYFEKNLLGKKPNLLFYDLYKLGYYSTLK